MCSNTHVFFPGDVPPPGTYDPKFDSNKAKGVGMDKMPNRFVEPKVPSSDSILQRSASLNALHVFRTVSICLFSVSRDKVFETN